MQHGRYPDVPDDFGHWLAGFIDGEGSFGIYAQPPGNWWSFRCVIALRADDKPVLDEIENRTGLGTVYLLRRSAPGARHPHAAWAVRRRPDLQRLIGLLDRFPLRAKKARDYAVWREACLYWLAHDWQNGPTWEGGWEPVRDAAAALRVVRAYNAPADLPALKIQKPGSTLF